MTRLLLSSTLCLLLFLSVSCSKDKKCESLPPQVNVPANEITAVEQYLSSNNISDAVKSNDGFYYKITEAGSGSSPSLCSNVSIFYTGSLTDGTIFDGTTSVPASFTLNQLISGWQLGVPLLKKGGRMMLYLPPSLAYGSRSTGPIPPNSVLIFDIKLVDFR
ncbi:MAG: FKBP-type peptidyl-prolyl cis-trans isomerase [bacterium]|jgi:FKBP-type peptidyl-prolyl cis-trans isomerase FkpA